MLPKKRELQRLEGVRGSDRRGGGVSPQIAGVLLGKGCVRFRVSGEESEGEAGEN